MLAAPPGTLLTILSISADVNWTSGSISGVMVIGRLHQVSPSPTSESSSVLYVRNSLTSDAVNVARSPTILNSEPLRRKPMFLSLRVTSSPSNVIVRSQLGLNFPQLFHSVESG